MSEDFIFSFESCLFSALHAFIAQIPFRISSIPSVNCIPLHIPAQICLSKSFLMEWLLTRIALFLSIYAIISWISLTIFLHLSLFFAFSVKFSCSCHLLRLLYRSGLLGPGYFLFQLDFVCFASDPLVGPIWWMFWNFSDPKIRPISRDLTLWSDLEPSLVPGPLKNMFVQVWMLFFD